MLEQRFARKTRPRIDARQRKTQMNQCRNGYNLTRVDGLLAPVGLQARVCLGCRTCLLAVANVSATAEAVHQDAG